LQTDVLGKRDGAWLLASHTDGSHWRDMLKLKLNLGQRHAGTGTRDA